MRVKELIEELKKQDENAVVTVIKQHDRQYQEMFGVHFVNHSHPVGGACLHLVKLDEDEGAGC